MNEPVISKQWRPSPYFAEEYPDITRYVSTLEAKVTEQAEYMRLAAIECKSLMEFRDEALRINREQAATIERLKARICKPE